MKTLIVSYLPRGPRSRTKRLLDHFAAGIKSGEVEHLDLIESVPPLFLRENLLAYYRRNYADEPLSDAEAGILRDMDRLTAQLQAADFVILAYPMFNLSVPAVVKAYFDAVLQKGGTWTFGPTGHPEGLLKG